MNSDSLELYVIQRKIITSRVLVGIKVSYHNLHFLGIHRRGIYVGILMPDIVLVVVQVNRIT